MDALSETNKGQNIGTKFALPKIIIFIINSVQIKLQILCVKPMEFTNSSHNYGIGCNTFSYVTHVTSSEATLIFFCL